MLDEIMLANIASELLMTMNTDYKFFFLVALLGLPYSPALLGHVLLFGHYISVWDFGLFFVEKYLSFRKLHFFPNTFIVRWSGKVKIEVSIPPPPTPTEENNPISVSIFSNIFLF